MNSQIREAAAHWLVEFQNDSPDVATRRRFAAWLRTSPEHISAYLSVLALWEDAQHYDPQHQLDIDVLVARARADRTITDLRTDDCADGVADTPVPEGRKLRASISRKTILRRLLRPRTAAAVFLSLVVNCVAIWIAMDSRNVAHTTQVAEQSAVVLTDGSRVDLDALSSLRVNFTSHERTVELLSGQAMFRVTKDANRPFVVRVGDERYRAVGTQFDVNRTTIGTVLTVVEGRVAVLPPSGPGARVDAGQQATIRRDKITVPQAVDTAAVTGWTRRLLIFASTPLPVAAEEFNRFNSRRLVIASPELVDFHVSGTYGAFDPDALADFVLFLRRQPGIEVLEKDNQITVQTHLAHQ
ncbi:MAG TPA: FecR domain-containing protein [Steroidobacteraceae bacterium]